MISAVVLAAGSSSRMGDTKPLLPLDGRPLLEHVLSAVRGSQVEDIVVVLGRDAERVRNGVSLDGARSIVNPAYDEGMSTSLRAGIDAADPRADGFLIVLGDQPFVSSATLDMLIERRSGSRAKIVIPTFERRRGNPVLLDRSLSSEVASIVGDQGCRAIFGNHPDGILEVPVDDPGILIDLDTPEQMSLAEATIRDHRPIANLLREPGIHVHTHEPSTAALPRTARIDVLALAQELRSRDEPFVLATVVRVERPSSGRPGYKAIVRPSRELIGWLGGSCAQSVLVSESLRALRDGHPRVMRLTPTAGRRPAEEGVVEYVMECASGGTMDIYLEPQVSKPRLLVVGDSPVAESLHSLGRVLEYRVIAVAPGTGEGAFPNADQILRNLDEIPGIVTTDTFAVVATMGKYDESALIHLADSLAAYVGLVASRRRAAAVFAALAEAGISAGAQARIVSPAGLDFSAETPEEIAVSILAQIIQVRRTSGPRDLPVFDEAAVPSVHVERDVVCAMDVPSGAPIRTTYGGKTYVFCSEGCRARFRKAPETFLT
ncbi:MAG TPA: NTP transferase domain-containing protein [Thermoplasmata archaeon]|nr:NTP transferase domain-containing protein [Thermoplasmata archaeon]